MAKKSKKGTFSGTVMHVMLQAKKRDQAGKKHPPRKGAAK